MEIVFNKNEIKDLRRALRREMPLAERQLWAQLRGKNVHGIKFRRQYSFGNYIVDFYCPAAHLAVEIDGEPHTEATEANDIRRQRIIEHYGITFLRFSNAQVYHELTAVVEMIAETALKKIRKEQEVGSPSGTAS